MNIYVGAMDDSGHLTATIDLTPESDIKPLIRKAGFDPDKYELTSAELVPLSGDYGIVQLKIRKKAPGIDFDRISFGG